MASQTSHNRENAEGYDPTDLSLAIFSSEAYAYGAANQESAAY